MTTTELLLDAPDPYLTRHRGYHVRLAVSQADVSAAARLRHDAGAGDSLSFPGPAGSDRDEFDDRCDHLIVWHQRGSGAQQLVATCRLLPPHSNDAAPRGSGLATDRDFGLMPLERLLDSTVEISGVVVHPDHREGTAVSLLFGAVARYLHLTGYRYLLGGVAMDGAQNAAAFWDLAVTRCLAPAERRCRPRYPLPIGGLTRADVVVIPALLAGCLRLGAKVCGPPATDGMSNTATFLLLLDVLAAEQRYLRRLLGSHG